MAAARLPVLKLNPRLDWRAGWRWWRAGLLAWLPTPMRRWLIDPMRRLVIAVDEREWALLREEAGSTQELERLDALSPDWIGVAGWRKTEQPSQLALRFPADQTLVRIVTLPLAAEKNLRQVAGFELDRLTPFTAAQAYYDVVVLERRSDQRRLRAELTMLPRASVDPTLLQLQQRGLAPDVLDVTGGRPELNLLPLEQRPRRGVWRQRLQMIVTVISLALVVLAVALPIVQQRWLAIEITARIDQAQRAVDQAKQLENELAQVSAAAQMPAQKKQTTPARIDLLRELTLLLPHDTWLERWQVKGDTLQIIGQSAKASALIGVIEASPLFVDAAFMSPITTDPRTSKERFGLGARISKEP